MALTGFLLIATETMPAGLLPQIASGLDVTKGTAGQFVSAYPLGVASVGTPVGLAVGTPSGSWLGMTFDWRWSFGVLAILTVITLLLAVFLVPDTPGQRVGTRVPFARVVAIPGVAVVLGVIVSWMLGHNIMYTYIGSYLRGAGLDLSVDVALVTFGAAAIAGIAITVP